MAVFEIEKDGKIFEVEAPNFDAAIKGIGSLPSTKAPADQGISRYGRQFTNALIPGADAIRAGAQTVGDAISGTDEPLKDRFNKNIQQQWDITNATNANNGLGDYTAKAAGMLAGGMALSKIPALAFTEAPVVASNLQRLVHASGESARNMAAFGAAQGALDSQATSNLGRLADTGAGMVGGAVVGGLFPGTLEAVMKVKDGITGVKNYIAGTRPEQRVAAQDAYKEFSDVTGKPPSLPATIQEEGPQAGVSRYLSNVGFLGRPVRRAAEEDVAAAQRALEAEMRRQTGGAPMNDVAKEQQDFIKNRLITHSKTKAELEAMPNEGLDRITGPIGESGFQIPKPRVEPVRPADVEPVQAERISPDSIYVDPVQPKPVTRPEITRADIKYENFPHSPEAQKEIGAAELRFQAAQKIANERANTFDAEFRQNPTLVERYKNDPEALWQDINHPTAGYQGPSPASSLPLRQAIEEREAARQALLDLKVKYEPVREAEWIKTLRAHYDEQNASADKAFNAARQQAIEEAQRETARKQQEALAQAQSYAEQRARAETQRLQDRAQADAWQATRKAEAEAAARYEQERRAAPGFEYGRSKESYPTEAAAAYERIAREAPPIQRNPLGGRGMSGSNYKTSTEGILDQFAQEARTDLKLPGYKNGQVFANEGVMKPELVDHLRGLLGKEVSSRVEAYAMARAKGQPVPGYEGLRSLRSAIRREARDAEFPKFPAEPRPQSAAALRRLEGAVSEDLRRFMSEAGPAGERAAAMDRQMDVKYSEFLKEMRKPLSKVFGDKVEPLQAMDKLSEAAKDANLSLLRPFMRVMVEKGEPGQVAKAGASIVAHATGEGKSLFDFVRAFGEIPKSSRNVIFVTPEGQAMRTRLEALEKIGQKLLPFEKAIKNGDQLKLGHHELALGSMLVFHATTAVAAGMGTAGMARLMASPRYMQALIRTSAVKTPNQAQQLMTSIANAGGGDSELGKLIVSGMSDALSPSKAKAAGGNGDSQEMFTSLEEPPSLDEVKKAVSSGVKRFDIDLDKEGADKAVSAIKKAGGKITAYHVGGGGGKAWGGASSGEQVNKFDTPESLAALTEDVKRLVTKGADDIHFDNTHRMSGKRLEQVADAIKAGGAGFVAKNNADKWNLVMRRRPDLKPAYAVIENAMHDADETQAAYDLHEKGVPVYIIAFRKPLEKGAAEVTDEYAKQYKKNNPWARVLLMDDENAYDGRTGQFIKDGADTKPSAPPPDIILKAARKSGLDVTGASIEDILDAAWKKHPTDEMAQRIEDEAKRRGVSPPWDKK